MANKLSIYATRWPDSTGPLSLEEVYSEAAGNIFKQDYTALSSYSIADGAILIAYNKDGDKADLYRLLDVGPWIQFAATINVGTDWDLLETFILGNQPHLLFYQRKNGTFAIHPLDIQLNSVSSFQYVRNHDPGVTQGFTLVKPFINRGGIIFMGYDFDSGRVAMYSLSVKAMSPPGTAPLLATNVWSHLWARGWTRFAFFQLGGENFFLKTNTVWTNVNIDHVLDDPKEGTAEVATHIESKDQEILSMSNFQPFSLGNGDPHFLAYKLDGTTNLYRINSDCLGWSKLSTSQTIPDTAQIVPVKVGAKQFFVFN